MSKNELQKIFDNTPAKSYKDKVKQIEDYFVSIADGVNVVVGAQKHQHDRRRVQPHAGSSVGLLLLRGDTREVLLLQLFVASLVGEHSSGV